MLLLTDVTFLVGALYHDLLHSPSTPLDPSLALPHRSLSYSATSIPLLLCHNPQTSVSVFWTMATHTNRVNGTVASIARYVWSGGKK
ncbi:hypothetical protein Vi05172_g12267 [Venturia inaequalis]|nr:hypothetical protein Vi05172_g12267 [Venturia inaequalis]